jgi:hypothetical protein
MRINKDKIDTFLGCIVILLMESLKLGLIGK